MEKKLEKIGEAAKLLGTSPDTLRKWEATGELLPNINVIRKEFDRYTEDTSRETRNAIDDLDNAFQHFFRRIKLKQKAG